MTAPVPGSLEACLAGWMGVCVHTRAAQREKGTADEEFHQIALTQRAPRDHQLDVVHEVVPGQREQRAGAEVGREAAGREEVSGRQGMLGCFCSALSARACLTWGLPSWRRKGARGRVAGLCAPWEASLGRE